MKRSDQVDPRAWPLLAAGRPPLATAAAQQVKVDAAIPAYQKTSGVSGNLNSIGSDTMNNLMTLWGEAFAKIYPNVKIQVEGKGSSTAPPALIAGTAQFGPMSRAMRGTEIDQFESKFGYKPTQLRTSYDALAVYVNKDNPLEKATLAEVDGAFSKSRRRGGKNVATWGQLGLTGDWAARPISLYGRNSASGTYGFFKEHALGNGDYKDTVKEQPGSASVVQGVTADRFGMGYSGHRLQDVGREDRRPGRQGRRRLLRRQLRGRGEPASTRWRGSSTSTSTRRRARSSTPWCASS